MGEHYSRIDFAERCRIQDMRDAKMPMTAIAEALGRHRSTIHREIRRNFHHDSIRDRWGKEYQGYFCTNAQRDAGNVSVVWRLRREWVAGAVHPCSGMVMFQGRRSAMRLIG